MGFARFTNTQGVTLKNVDNNAESECKTSWVRVQ